MTARSGAWAAALSLAAATAAAQPAAAIDPGWSAGAAVLHRHLVEKADDGSRLVTESGALLRLSLAREYQWAGGQALRAEAGVVAGTLDYDGRTQGGAPLATDTRHRDFDLTLAWRPLAPASWGEAWLVLRTARELRDIRSTASAGGLRETSTLVLPGVRWSRDFAAAGWNWTPSLELRTSVSHRLHVDYEGLFDNQDLHGGHRNEMALALTAWTPSSPWRWSLEWTRARQQASDTDAVRRAGVAVGTVHQPRIEIDDVMLRATRAF